VPVRFNIQAGKKYIIYMKKISQGKNLFGSTFLTKILKPFYFCLIGRYVPWGVPDEYTRKTKQLIKKFSCPGCSKFYLIFVNFFENFEFEGMN